MRASVKQSGVNEFSHASRQTGFALLSVIAILLVVSIMATGNLNLSGNSETLAGNAIQRSRAFQAADGATSIAEAKLQDMVKSRLFSDDSASEGIFSRDSRGDHWWRGIEGAGVHVVDESSVLGVVEPPRFVMEEVGQYVSDGGSGVASLDIGGAAYGRKSSSGREVILYSVEAHGKGSYENVETVIESTFVFTY